MMQNWRIYEALISLMQGQSVAVTDHDVGQMVSVAEVLLAAISPRGDASAGVLGLGQEGVSLPLALPSIPPSSPRGVPQLNLPSSSPRGVPPLNIPASAPRGLSQLVSPPRPESAAPQVVRPQARSGLADTSALLALTAPPDQSTRTAESMPIPGASRGQDWQSGTAGQVGFRPISGAAGGSGVMRPIQPLAQRAMPLSALAGSPGGSAGPTPLGSGQGGFESPSPGRTPTPATTSGAAMLPSAPQAYRGMPAFSMGQPAMSSGLPLLSGLGYPGGASPNPYAAAGPFSGAIQLLQAQQAQQGWGTGGAGPSGVGSVQQDPQQRLQSVLTRLVHGLPNMQTYPGQAQQLLGQMLAGGPPSLPHPGILPDPGGVGGLAGPQVGVGPQGPGLGVGGAGQIHVSDLMRVLQLLNLVQGTGGGAGSPETSPLQPHQRMGGGVSHAFISLPRGSRCLCCYCTLVTTTITNVSV
jgi:hypothetical protein